MIEKPLSNPDTADFETAVERTKQHSRYFQRLISAEPQLLEELQQSYQRPFSAGEIEAFLTASAITDETSLNKLIRQLRKRVMVRVYLRDLNGLGDLSEVMLTMTDLAEITLRLVHSHQHRWLAEIFGDPISEETKEKQELIVIGMGKLGGRELNVSSDIDLIFVYPEGGETNGRKKISSHDFFTKLGQKIISSMHDITADGFVFRVDMRLRPYGDSGSLVVSFAMLENYLITQARTWERYAWIKGRAICGTRIDELEQLRRPFVYRKYLDYGALDELRKLHGQIREEAKRRDALTNIKIGPGGIREIEFIAQVFQLIRGGRERDLQIMPTLEVLSLLASRRLLPNKAVEKLQTAYAFLRNLEHRLQYLEDAQTQALPEKEEDQTIIASAMNFSDYASFMAILTQHKDNVIRHFENVFTAETGKSSSSANRLWQGSLSLEEATPLLEQLGYEKPEVVLQTLDSMRKGSHYVNLPEKNRSRLETLMPRVIEIAGKLKPAEITLTRIINVLESIDRRESYLALLAEYPPVLERIARLISVSAWATDYLRRHPILLDELLDTNALLAPPHWRKLAKELRKELEALNDDTERQMDYLRHFKQSQIFRLLAQNLEGLMTVERLSDHLSMLADQILAETVRLCWQKTAGREAAPPRIAVIGYGKLGSKELGYVSDLDIIFLYDDVLQDQRDQFTRLAQRVVSWLNSTTTAGKLYETDLRLRPDGESGLLITSVNSFREYQEKHAWVWEHQAITRARYCVGDATLGEAFEDIRIDVLTAFRDVSSLRQEVITMREKMYQHKKVPEGLFDAKHSKGGLIDIEFIVQFLILAYSHRYWELTRNVGTIALLRTIADLKLIPIDLGYEAANSYKELRQLQHLARLNDQTDTRIPVNESERLTAAPLELWKIVFEA